jgi:hypothetical protein
MSKAIPFASIRVGEMLGPVETRVTAEAMQSYCQDWDDPNPWYTGDSPFGGSIMPPAFMAGLTGFSLLATRFDTRATIGTKTRHRNLGVVRVPGTLATRGRIADKYVRRGLEYVVVESTSHDQHGNPVRQSQDHILLSLERVAVPDTPRAAGRLFADAIPLAKSHNAVVIGSRRLAVGDPIPPTAKTIYQRSLAERHFSEDSIHRDDYTRQQGYPGALVSAYVLAGYMSEPMVRLFGSDWFTTGEIALTFVGSGVQQGDAVTCHGRVAGIGHADDRPVLTLDVWMEKQHGSKPVIGTAHGRVEAATIVAPA